MPNLKNALWFGNQNFMQWVVPPKINYDASRQGKVYQAQYTNGGAFVRRSATGARHYNFSWDLKHRDELQPILDYADGVYGTENPIYFIDPFAADRNLLPQFWAVPALGADDAPQIYGRGDLQRPDKVGTSANTLRLPSYSAVFTMASGKANPPVYIPIPPGYTLWVGAYGNATGNARVSIVPSTGPTTFGSAFTVPLLSVDNPALFSTSVGSVPGAFLQINGTTGTLALSGIIARLYPNGVTPPTGVFISGQGHSGCMFNDNPVYTHYSAALDRVGLSVDLIETEGWK